MRSSRFFSSSSALALLSLCLCLLLLLTPACGRTITWSQSGGGNLQAAANWDAGVVPTQEDDVVIKLLGGGSATSAHTQQHQQASDPWDPDSHHSNSGGGDDSGSGALLTLMQGWSVRSLSLTSGGGSASLVVDSQLHVAGELAIGGGGAQVLVKGGQLEAAVIEVTQGGTLAVDLGTVGNTQSGGGGGGSSPQLQLHIRSGGTLLCSSSGGGSSIFGGLSIQVGSGGQVVWEAGPLVMDNVDLALDPGATFRALADILTQADPKSKTSIRNAGNIIFDATNMQGGGSSSQMIGIPLSNTGSLVVTGPLGLSSELRILNTFKQDGSLLVSGSRTLSLSFSLAEFGAHSRTTIDNNATILCQSGEARFGGQVVSAPGSEGGEMVVSALASQSGNFDLNRLVMRGGTLDTAKGATSTTKMLRWASGVLSGEGGSVHVGHPSSSSGGDNGGGGGGGGGGGDGLMVLEDPPGNKVLAGAALHIFGEGRLQRSTNILLQTSAEIHVAPLATLTHLPGSQIQSGDNSPVAIKLDEGAKWIFELGQIAPSSLMTLAAATENAGMVNASIDATGAVDTAAGSMSSLGLTNNSTTTASSPAPSGPRIQTIIGVPLSSRADLVVRGYGEAVFRREGSFRTLRAEGEGAGVRLQGLDNSTRFTFGEPIDLPQEGQYLLLQSARLDFESATTSRIRNLVLVDGFVNLKDNRVPSAQSASTGLDVLDTLALGSPTSSSHLVGPGPVRAKSVRLQAGKIDVEKMDVSGELLISSAGGKELNLLNLTLLSGSWSRVVASQTRVGDSLHWLVESNATLVLEGGAHLHASGPSDAHTGTPCLRVRGRLRWAGRSGEQAGASVEIFNENRMELRNKELMDLSAAAAEIPTVAAANGDSAAAAIASIVASAPFETILLGGFRSSGGGGGGGAGGGGGGSFVSLGQATLLSSSCPPNITDARGCTFGRFGGGGQMQLTGLSRMITYTTTTTSSSSASDPDSSSAKSTSSSPDPEEEEEAARKRANSNNSSSTASPDPTSIQSPDDDTTPSSSPHVVHELLPQGSFGLSPPASQRLQIGFFVLAGLLAALATALFLYALNMREQLNELRKQAHAARAANIVLASAAASSASSAAPAASSSTAQLQGSSTSPLPVAACSSSSPDVAPGVAPPAAPGQHTRRLSRRQESTATSETLDAMLKSDDREGVPHANADVMI